MVAEKAPKGHRMATLPPPNDDDQSSVYGLTSGDGVGRIAPLILGELPKYP